MLFSFRFISVSKSMPRKIPHNLVNILTNPIELKTCQAEYEDIELPKICIDSETLKSSQSVDVSYDSMTPAVAHQLSVHHNDHLSHMTSIRSILSIMASRSNRPSFFSNIRKGIGILKITQNILKKSVNVWFKNYV